MTETYCAIALQIAAQSIENASNKGQARQLMANKIDEIAAKLRGALIFTHQYTGQKARLVVLPEYVLTSYPGRIGVKEFADVAALEMDGKEYESLGKVASDNGIFLCGNAYEKDVNFGNLYFQTCFIISPAGDVVLRYRRLNSMFAPTPHDVLKKYLDIYGLKGLFPVAKTEIGNLAAIASEEILYPEIARSLAFQGAEIFVHSSSEVGSPLPTHKSIAKQARAIENIAYVISANTAGIDGTNGLQASADGFSVIIDYKGREIAKSNSGETFTAFSEIDVSALRKARRQPGMTNYLSRQRNELFALSYSASQIQSANSLLCENEIIVPNREHFQRVQEITLERMIKEGII